jgi:hypothetical protein
LLIPAEFKINNVIIGFMTTQEWTGLILTVLSILAIVGVGVRWIVKKYVEDIVYEMKPNNGSSIKDQITRLEEKTEKIFDLMIEHLKDHSK